MELWQKPVRCFFLNHANKRNEAMKVCHTFGIKEKMIQETYNMAACVQAYTVIPISKDATQKITWQWNIHHLKMYFLLNMLIFQLAMLVFGSVPFFLFLSWRCWILSYQTPPNTPFRTKPSGAFPVLCCRTWSWRPVKRWIAASNKNEWGASVAFTLAEVTLNGGLVRESPPNPLNSGLGIIQICPPSRYNVKLWLTSCFWVKLNGFKVHDWTDHPMTAIPVWWFYLATGL